MHKKLTITIEEEVYKALHEVIGRNKISQFIESLIKPHVINHDLDRAYQQMAEDLEQEQEALEWANATYKDSFDETRCGGSAFLLVLEERYKRNGLQLL